MPIIFQSPYVTSEDRKEIARHEAEDVLIAVYVPEASVLPRDKALSLALERDLLAAQQLAADFA